MAENPNDRDVILLPPGMWLSQRTVRVLAMDRATLDYQTEHSLPTGYRALGAKLGIDVDPWSEPRQIQAVFACREAGSDHLTLPLPGVGYSAKGAPPTPEEARLAALLHAERETAMALVLNVTVLLGMLDRVGIALPNELDPAEWDAVIADLRKAVTP